MAVEITPEGTRGRPFPRNPLLHFFLAVNRTIFRLARGRGPVSNMLLLSTVGGRTGKTRVVPLAYFADGDGAWLIVASAGGDARHPAWYRNLARNPDRVAIELGGRRVQVRPEQLKGEARAEAWGRITSKSPNFARYERQTDREIPVIRLTRA